MEAKLITSQLREAVLHFIYQARNASNETGEQNAILRAQGAIEAFLRVASSDNRYIDAQLEIGDAVDCLKAAHRRESATGIREMLSAAEILINKVVLF